MDGLVWWCLSNATPWPLTTQRQHNDSQLVAAVVQQRGDGEAGSAVPSSLASPCIDRQSQPWRRCAGTAVHVFISRRVAAWGDKDSALSYAFSCCPKP